MLSTLLSLTPRVEGIPLPYAPSNDNTLAAILIVCFFLSAVVLSRHHKFLGQLIKDFLLHRERTSIFSTSTAGDVRSLLLLSLQTCMLASVTLFCLFAKQSPQLIQHLSSLQWIALFFIVSLLYFALKWMLYSLLGWIFFDRTKTSLWLESYSTLVYYLGFALFPFVLIVVYFNQHLPFIIVFSLIFVSITKILMIYKWIKLFCENFYGSMLIIMYFCALEMLPCILLYNGMLQLTNYLIIKF
ncbi:MAG: DUF4271 domain-containing protein [Bacteroides sp.]